jgi:hypothetical protein
MSKNVANILQDYQNTFLKHVKLRYTLLLQDKSVNQLILTS